MATIAEHLVISLGLDPRPLQSGLNQVKSMAMRWAGPIAGAFSISKMFQSYVQSVSWVAKVTGAYFQKYEDYRYKMAMLSRVTREDIQLYRQYREGLMRFNIAMGDLSMKIVREFYPAFRIALDLLNKFSTWVSGNHDNIIRFLKVTAAVIGTVLIPTILRLTAALLANPLTWFIALLMAVILVIDDFVTYVQGGKSELEELWRAFGTPEELRAKFKDIIEFLKGAKDIGPLLGTIAAITGGILAMGGAVLTVAKAFKGLKSVIKGISLAFTLLGRHPVIALLTAAATLLIARWDAVKEGFIQMVNDMSEYWNNSSIGKFFNWFIQDMGAGIERARNALLGAFGMGNEDLKEQRKELTEAVTPEGKRRATEAQIEKVRKEGLGLPANPEDEIAPSANAKPQAEATTIEDMLRKTIAVQYGLKDILKIPPTKPEEMGTGRAANYSQQIDNKVSNSGNNITVNINAPTGEEGVNEFKDTLTDLFPIDDANTGTRQ